MWDLIQKVTRKHGMVKCHWVPSHGKHMNWRPPDGFRAEEWRYMNDCADRAATEVIRKCEDEYSEMVEIENRTKVWAKAALQRQWEGTRDLWTSHLPSTMEYVN